MDQLCQGSSGRPRACAMLFGDASFAEEIRYHYAESGLNPFKDSTNQHINEYVDPRGSAAAQIHGFVYCWQRRMNGGTR